MHVLVLLKAAFLGVVEGITEFLPVSSTGHLIIAGDVVNFTGNDAKVFEIVIQLGAILAVVWLYRERLIRVVTRLYDRRQQHFVLNLLISFMPAAVVGLATHHYIMKYLFSPITVASALIVGGVAILVIERLPLKTRVTDIDSMTYGDALKVGIAQTFSLFPGVSRAAATIMGGLLSGLTRTAATEYSFFLAIPTMIAATCYELFKNRQLLHGGQGEVLAVGFVISFIVAIGVVKVFLRFISSHTFAAFAWYRIVFGALVLLYFW